MTETKLYAGNCQHLLLADPRRSKSGWIRIGTGGSFAIGMPGGFDIEISGCFDRNTLAASLRRRTHASLLAELPSLAVDPPIELLDEAQFDQRLQKFGYPADPEFSFEFLEKAHVISTADMSARDIEY
jgi:hypothetical protein